jgi:RNA polymerase sigma factor (sigma-70 family)
VVDGDSGLTEAGEGTDAADRVQFEAFYRAQYRSLVRMVRVHGAGRDEAAPAVDEAMADVLRRWRQIENPRAYARTAVLRNLVKTRVRDGDRLRRTIAGGQVTPEGTDDAGLTIWEDEQWVTQLLDALPPAQRDVMVGLYGGMTTAEIADLLGKTPEAVRQTLRRARAVLREELARQSNEGSPSPGTTKEEPR